MKRALAALAAGLVSLSAHAGDDLLASLSWQLDFGGAGVHAGYDVSLGYRGANDLSPLSRVLEFSAAGNRASATLAGIPWLGHSFRADEAAAADETLPAQKPWYARSWVLWTAGGIAATAALASSGGVSVGGSDTTNNGKNCTGVSSTGTDVPDTCVPQQEVGCTPAGLCVNCGNNTITDKCDGWTARQENEAWLSGGDETAEGPTGGMGDLVEIARQP